MLRGARSAQAPARRILRGRTLRRPKQRGEQRGRRRGARVARK